MDNSSPRGLYRSALRSRTGGRIFVQFIYLQGEHCRFNGVVHRDQKESDVGIIGIDQPVPVHPIDYAIITLVRVVLRILRHFSVVGICPPMGDTWPDNDVT